MNRNGKTLTSVSGRQLERVTPRGTHHPEGLFGVSDDLSVNAMRSAYQPGVLSPSSARPDEVVEPGPPSGGVFQGFTHSEGSP